MKQPFFLILSLIFIMACSSPQEEVEQFNKRLESIAENQIKDRSLEYFKVHLVEDSGQYILDGATTNGQAHHAVLELAETMLPAYQNQIELLPQKSLGDSTYAIVKVSVAHLRRNPRAAAEMIDQAIMGNVLKLLKKKKSWYLVQTHYGYIGWMQGYSLHRTDKKAKEEWETSHLLTVNQLFALLYHGKDRQSVPVTDLVLNARLKMVSSGKKWIKAATPDGRLGYLPRTSVRTPSQHSNTIAPKAEYIIATAKSMMGVPYQWGGNSSKGNDCSGFAQTAFKANGIQLPRDARQQVFEGEAVDYKEDFSNVKAGDLLFFGLNERITHVGISLGGYEFIHQDSDVNIDSFDKNADNFNARRLRMLKNIRRILK